MPELCSQCGRPIDWPPTCYGSDAPWRECGVSDSDFESRVELTADQCVVDRKHFFVRGHIEIPVLESSRVFLWSVWCSLSEASFRHMTTRWNDPDRELDPPYFGWLQTSLPCYLETVPTKTSIQSRAPGIVPCVSADPDTLLGQEQSSGIPLDRVIEFSHAILGPERCPCDRCGRR